MNKPIKKVVSVLMRQQEHEAMKAIASSKKLPLNQLIIKSVLQNGI